MTEHIVVTLPRFTEKAIAILRTLGEVKHLTGKRTELLKQLSPATVLVTGLEQRIDTEMLDAAPNLKILAVPATGLDHVDEAEAEKRGIRILSLQGEKEFLQSVTSTAELALGLLLSLVRHIPQASASVLEGAWDRERFRGNALKGKTLGILGMGRLGKMMAAYGEALGMTVLFSDPNVKGGVARQLLLEEADVVSIHVPFNDETKGMIEAKALALLKPTAVIINTSRGGIVDEKALMEALQKNQLKGYAADVLGNETSFEGTVQNTLVDYAKNHENVLLTPHIGGCTDEDREKTDVFIVEEIAKALKN
jgi:D-3-phosphoglycerate dehydrogenase